MMKRRSCTTKVVLLGVVVVVILMKEHRVVSKFGTANLGMAALLSLPQDVVRQQQQQQQQLSTFDSSSEADAVTNIPLDISSQKVAVGNCSAADMKRIEELFWEIRPKPRKRSRRKNKIPFKPRITGESDCPDQTWLWEYLQTSATRESPFVGVFVGCNKGFDAINMAAKATNNPAYNKTEWVSLFREKSDAHAVCAADAPIEGNAPEQSSSASISIQEGEFHCIEAVQSTAALLNRVSDKMGLSAQGFTISNVVMSNYTGTVDFISSNAYTGSEFLSIEMCGMNKPMAFRKHCVKHPVYSLDDYASKFIASQGMIDLLTIDTEGYDAPVLMGGEKVLSRTRYLEFEVSMRGNWADHPLIEVIETLADKFHCYVAGKGRLFRITGCVNEKMKDLYNRNYWVNVACVSKKETRMVTIMENLFRESLKA